MVQLRDDTMLEICCSHALPGQEVFEAVLGWAAAALQCALLESRRGVTGELGELLSGAAMGARPTVVSLPLELGQRRHGAVCLLCSDTARRLSSLDYEILEALADQAALALAASCQRTALNRLEASINAISRQAN